MRRLPTMAISLVLVLAGCRGGDRGPGQTGEPPENPTTGESSTAATTSGSGTPSEESGEIECGSGEACPPGLHCAALHQAGLRMPAGDFTCRAECIPAGSTSFWCLDDSSCCDGAICDTAFGLCDGTGSTGTTDGSATGGRESTSSDTGAGTSEGDTTGSTGSTGSTSA